MWAFDNSVGSEITGGLDSEERIDKGPLDKVLFASLAIWGLLRGTGIGIEGRKRREEWKEVSTVLE
jgi:hypothetical protein